MGDCNLETILLTELEDTDEKAVQALVACCNTYDGTAYDPVLSADFCYLVRNEEKEDSGCDADIIAVLAGYRVGEQAEGLPVLEIEAFTHPALRRLGLFRLCFDSLRDDFRGFRYRFIVKPQKAGPSPLPEDTQQALLSLGAVHSHDELLLRKTLARPIRNPKDSLCCQYGEVHLTSYDKETLYLYGLLVYDRFLHQGYGRKLMEAVESSPEGRYRHILLQVSSENIPALRLYRSLAYETEEAISYYYL